MIQFDLEMSQKNSGEKRVFRNWKKADWDNIRQGIETSVAKSGRREIGGRYVAAVEESD